MLYLLLAILCSSSIALIFKYSETHDMNRYAVTSTNYFTALVVSLIMVITSKLDLLKDISVSSFFKDFTKVVLHNNSSFSPGSSLTWAIIIGIVAGFFFFLSLIYYQKSVNENGVGISGCFGKLGILIPMLLSIILWRELPTLFQWFGILLSLLSITIVNLPGKNSSKTNFSFTLILLFLFGGLAEFSNKIFQKYAIVDYKSVFLLFVFLVAFLISMYFTLKSKNPITKFDLVIGFMVGIPNLFSSFFLILALNYIKTSVAFPIYSAGSILLINLGGFIIFKEKLKPKDLFSILLTILALIFINI